MMKKALVLLALLVFLSCAPAFAQYTLYHAFEGGGGGYYPSMGPQASDGTTLYGTTEYGGDNACGCLYRIDATGSNFQVLYSFTGGTTGAGRPNSNPILAGSWLYGTSLQGGTNGGGTIYKIGTDGNNFTILHSFGSSEGAHPYSGLTLIGSTLYGMTKDGGTGYLGGMVFKIDTDGNNYAVVHVFAGTESDGYGGFGSMTTDGSLLYGTTLQGGTSNKGVIFKLDPAGPTLTILHSFTGSPYEGDEPSGYLVLDNGYLYGMTHKGGGSDKGTVFMINMGESSSENYHRLHDFSGGLDDGDTPVAGLIKSPGILYGFTTHGGSAVASCSGTMFMVANSGYGFALLFRFANASNYSNNDPQGGLLCGSKVIGTTHIEEGTIFSYDLSPRADVAISMWPDNSNPQGGTNVNFTIQAQNNGPYPATSIQVTDLLPAQLTYVSNSTSLGSFEPTTGVWDIERLDNDPGTGTITATLTLTAKVNSSGVISNTATRTAETEIDTDSGNDSATSTITTSSTKNLLPPILLSPASGAVGQPSTATLGWQDTNTNPQEVKYKVRLKKQGGAYVNYALAAGTTQFTKSGLTPGKTYYWNVQALGNGTSTKTSAWANGGFDFSFTVAPPVTLTPPTLLTPASGATDQSLSPTLYWGDTNSSPNELHYKVRFKIAGGTYAITTLGPDVTSLLKTGLKSGKTYYWSVMAIGNGTSIKSSVWPADYHFTTAIIK